MKTTSAAKIFQRLPRAGWRMLQGAKPRSVNPESPMPQSTKEKLKNPPTPNKHKALNEGGNLKAKSLNPPL